MYNLVNILAINNKIRHYLKDFYSGIGMPEFKNLRKRARRRRIETMLLAGYAFAVTCALFLSLLNKPTGEYKVPLRHLSDDSFEVSSDVLTPAFEDSAADNPFELAYAQINSIQLLSDQDIVIQKFELTQNGHTEVVMPLEAKPKLENKEISGIYQKEHHVLVVKSGDTFIGMLKELGMDTKTATEAYNTLRKVFDARNLKINQYLELTGTFDVQSRQLEALDTLTFEPSRGTKYILRVNEYDQFETKVEQEKFAKDTRVIKGVIESQASVSMAKAGIPRAMVDEIIRRFGHLINFRTDIHKGDNFSIKYEVSKAADGSIIRTGNLLYASFTTSSRTYKLYRYKDEFYTEKGEAKKTGLDIKPMQFRNARISSLYGYRMHPIHKTRKFHSGVDYAAPKGTQIYASGNGTVEMARYVNGYGNFVKIRHNSEYETAYGHMQGFAKGIRPGVRVRKGQLIGYVGSTGRSTGPHLHFEIILKGQRINPLKAKVATGNDLTGRQLADFKQEMRRIDAAKETIAKVKIKKELELGKTAQKLAARHVKKVMMLPSPTPQEDITTNTEIMAKQQSATGVNGDNETAEKIEASISDKVAAEEPNDKTKNQAEQVVEKEISVIDASEEKVESSSVISEEAKYEGKVIYPIREQVAELRKQYKMQSSPLLSKMAKVVKVPARKPKPSKQTLR